MRFVGVINKFELIMDSKENIGSPDRERINVNEDYELQYWSQKFGITRDELIAAVKPPEHQLKM
jgi:hypothetical protein